ncbi:type II secretion system protein [Selenomonas dianae]|uniref:Type II secretion system protein n=1 Tax=Selenomonas dianae TaxID=135079 RepID=A0ABP3CFS5_9FIRM|nr:type II secretion system protein [Selenomonas dianae]WLD82814.1 type II secretion system protein [Selenomonas dianae]
MHRTRCGEAGHVLLEAVLLGLIVLAVAASLGIFARTALLREYAAARMEAALVARAQFSRMEAALDTGVPPPCGVTEVRANERIYRVETSVTRTEDFYDVQLRLSWQIAGHAETVDFVRRMRHHVRVEDTSGT